MAILAAIFSARHKGDKPLMTAGTGAGRLPAKVNMRIHPAGDLIPMRIFEVKMMTGIARDKALGMPLF